MNDNAKILVGKIVAPQGIRGEVRVQSFAEQTSDFKNFHVVSEKFNSESFHFVRVVPNANVVPACKRLAGIGQRPPSGRRLFGD